MHNNFLVERSGKMSKSSGEFLRLQLLIDKGYHPLAYRMLCLQAHYRSELEFSWEGLGAALVRLKRLVMAWERLKQTPPKAAGSPTAMEQLLSNHETAFDGAISEDLNTAVALTVFEDLLGDKKISSDFRLERLRKFDEVLGFGFDRLLREDLRLRPKTATITEDEIEAVLTRRKEARAAKDFATSDALRDELAARGVEVMDGDPLGWDWKLGEG
jgi:cysteinyl-tRNA synthetase